MVYLEKDVYLRVILKRLSASLTHPYQCSECQQRSYKFYDATAHYLITHQDSNEVKEDKDFSPDRNCVSPERHYVSPESNYVSAESNYVSLERNYVSQERMYVSPERNTIKKNFKCQICSKTFGGNWKLKRHEKAHLNDNYVPAIKRSKKIFKCDICDKTFKDNWKLNRHGKVHVKITV